jgi:hypothetical protein
MKNELPHLLKPQSDLAPTSHHFGVVLAVADASPRLAQCLAALSAAMGKAVTEGHRAELFVVIDGRNAESAAIASNYAVHLVTADFSDLASARAIGARAALSSGASWLAFTECSALVADSWLIEQISTDSELLLGSVEITNGFMAEQFHDERSGWHDVDAHATAPAALQLSANFSNLGMSRSAFELACHLGGRQLRLDAALLDQLASLQITTHRCSKPLVYARMQGLDQILFGGDAPVCATPVTGDSPALAQCARSLVAAPIAPALLSIS